MKHETDPSPSTTTTHVDRERLRADLEELGVESRVLKTRLRQRWTEPMGAVQRKLLDVQRRTTDRLVLLAWTRGRFHVRQMPRSGAIPGTDQYYLQDPATGLLRLVHFDPEAHRDQIVRALEPEYRTAVAPPEMAAELQQQAHG